MFRFVNLEILNACFSYAFVEFEDPHDAEDAFNEMHGRRIDGYTISVQVRK
jgi:RNA recognition motif-containing protein